MFSELKAFLMRGNVLDMAVGVTIGGAFGKIVDSLVNNLISPLVAMVSGGADLTKSFAYGAVADPKTGELVGGFQVGAFLQSIINFVIIGVVLYMLVKSAQKGGASGGAEAIK